MKPPTSSAEPATASQHQNGDTRQSPQNGHKKESVVISKKSLHPPPGPAPRNLNVRNNVGPMQQNYFKRDFVWEL